MAGAARIELAPGYVLHQLPWRDSSRIYEVLTRDHGRLSLFARGVRGPKSRVAGVLQPFQPVLLSFTLRGEAGNLTTAEPGEQPVGLPALGAEHMMAGFYLSELILKLTLRHDAQPEIYLHYHRAVLALRAGAHVARELRLFEKRLLESLGYGLDLSGGVADEGADAAVGYHYAHSTGLSAAAGGESGSVSAVTLRSLAEERLQGPVELEEARLLLRKALAACLEGRTLKTRQVAEEMRGMRRIE
jgi:DNA repair protein RecO (recombination protein O)